MHRPGQLGGRPAPRGFTLVELIVVVTIMATLATAGMGMLSTAIDTWRTRSAGDRLYFVLQKAIYQIRVRNPPDIVMVGYDSYGVILIPGTLTSGGQVLQAGFSLLPWGVNDAMKPLPKPSNPAMSSFASWSPAEKYALIPLDPAVRLTTRYNAGSGWPPAQPSANIVLQYKRTGELDETMSSVGLMIKEEPFAGDRATTSYTFDIVAQWGYQRFRIRYNGSVDRSLWTPLDVATPQSEGYGTF